MARIKRSAALALALAVMAATAAPVHAKISTSTKCYFIMWITGESTQSAYDACR